MNLRVDLNADLGEGAGHDAELLALVSSANIACGLHAGNPTVMRAAMAAAQIRGVAIGAHPSFDDRENFGRREMQLVPEELFALVVEQLRAFRTEALALGICPHHVKPHGALYNMAARDETMADAIVRAVVAVDPSLIVYAPAASALSRAGEALQLRVAREAFADRNYMPDGSLVPRARPDALLHDPTEAAARVLRMLREGVVRSIGGSDAPINADTICVHGDTPGAVEFARTLRNELVLADIAIAAPAQASRSIELTGLPAMEPDGPPAGSRRPSKSKGRTGFNPRV